MKKKNTIKDYAKKYKISVLKNGKPKSVLQLSLDIYEYEKTNQVSDGLYPFLRIK
jgi:hypothetical protein